MSAKIAEAMFSRSWSVAVSLMDFSKTTAFWLLESAIAAITRGTSMPTRRAVILAGTSMIGNRANFVFVDPNESYARNAKTIAVPIHTIQKKAWVHFGMPRPHFDVFFGAFFTGALCGVGGVLSILRSTSSGRGIGLGFCFMAGV
jgi:hypothetical protein